MMKLSISVDFWPAITAAAVCAGSTRDPKGAPPQRQAPAKASPRKGKPP